MAGEGTKYIKKKATEEARALILKYFSQQPPPGCVLGKMSSDRTEATLPDGSKIDVTPVGKVGDYAVVCEGAVAHTPEPVVYNIDGRKDTGYILFKSTTLFIRKIGSSQPRIAVPALLPAAVAQDIYTGGFSSDGKNMYIAGYDIQDSGANIILHWCILHDFSIGLDPNDGITTVLAYDHTTSGSINLNDKWEENILPQLDAPIYGEVDTRGLAGQYRQKYVLNFWPSFSAGYTYTVQDQLDFIQYLIDYFEITPEEATLLFPPDLYVALYKYAVKTNQFAPAMTIEYDMHTSPIEELPTPGRGVYCGGVGWYPYAPGCRTIREAFFNGWRNISIAVNTIKPVFAEAGFAFNVNEQGEPVLDAVITYQTTAVYEQTSVEWDSTWRIVSINGGSVWTGSSGKYTRHNNEAYAYTYPEDGVYMFDNTGDWLDQLGFTVTNTNQGQRNLNFYMENDGYWNNIDDPPTVYPSPSRYYSVGWFNDGFESGQSCSQLAAATYPAFFSCQYYLPGLEAATSIAAFTWYGGFPLVAVAYVYPPDPDGTYTYNTFDWQTQGFIGNAVTQPTFFGTSYPYNSEPYFHGFYTQEDVTGGWGPEPFARPYQFGRGVMAITNVNGETPGYRYIDRPPAISNDFDHLTTLYLGVNGSRACTTQEDHYRAYAYSPEYTNATNQIVGLNPPDTFTDIYYIDFGTWPYPASLLKAVDSTKFVQYTQLENGNEDIKHYDIQVNPTKVTQERRAGGTVPDYALGTTVIDYIVRER